MCRLNCFFVGDVTTRPVIPWYRSPKSGGIQRPDITSRPCIIGSPSGATTVMQRLEAWLCRPLQIRRNPTYQSVKASGLHDDGPTDERDDFTDHTSYLWSWSPGVVAICLTAQLVLIIIFAVMLHWTRCPPGEVHHRTSTLSCHGERAQ